MRCLNRQARLSSCCGLISSSSGTASFANSCTTIGMTTYVSESVRKDLHHAHECLSLSQKGPLRWAAEGALLTTLCMVKKKLQRTSKFCSPAEPYKKHTRLDSEGDLLGCSTLGLTDGATSDTLPAQEARKCAGACRRCQGPSHATR